MPVLIPVQYGRMRYPNPIHPHLVEVPGHFDKEAIPTGLQRYSLHTEYSAGERAWSGNLIKRFATLLRSQTRGIPRLWTSSLWAREFAEFVSALVADNAAPDFCEIHPPFRKDCTDMDRFLDLVFEFQSALPARLSNMKVGVENRHGTRLANRFLVSTADDVVGLGRSIGRTGSTLMMVLDVPQLLHGEGIDPARASADEIAGVLDSLRPVVDKVAGIHLWARSRRGGTHVADLDEYFGGRTTVKEAFFRTLARLLDDGHHRYFVPEVNYGKSDAIEPMVRDLQAVGFEFTGPDDRDAYAGV
ncbi:MAG: hypothetical protein ACOX5Q_09165 [Bacillota bacterium]